MMISTKGRYAMRLIIDIADHEDGGPVSLKEVANREDMPVKYLEQLVRPLTRDGILRSVRGQRGGYLLARSASDISAGDILRCVEGSIAPVACLSQQTVCPRKDACTTFSFWQGLDAAIDSYVDSVALEQLRAPHAPSCKELRSLSERAGEAQSA